MKRLRACVLAVAIGLAAPSLAAPAFAQEAANPDVAAREALARRYFVAMQFDKMMNVMLESMTTSMMANSTLAEDKRDFLRDALLETYDAVLPQMIEAYVDLFAETFTLDELQQLVNFYESPVGRSVMAKSVLLSQQAGPMLERFQPIMERELTTRLCARIDCDATPTGAANK